MSLLHMLKAREKESGFFLSAVNCEHGIRGENSLADTRFVKDVCRQWGVPLFTFSADCPEEAAREKISLETAARNFRYRSFQSLLDGGRVEFIATAHHLGDEAETVLFRLARGTSLSGAKGMEERKGRYLRPLLGVSKAEILEYVRKNGIPFREDESNFRTDATRNKLRLEVLPALERAVPGAAENLARFAKSAAEDDELLYALAGNLVEKREAESAGDTGYRLHFSDKAPLFRRACLCILKDLGVERDYTSAHLVSVFALQGLQTGSRATLPNGLEARRTYDGISFYRRDAEREKNAPFEEIKFSEGEFDAGRYEIIVNGVPADGLEGFGKSLRLDGDAVPEGAVFRFRREGDEFRPFGGKRKKLKKYLIDKKIPQEIRAGLPVLAESGGREIYAVCGAEIADGVRITENTVRPLYITIRKKSEEKNK